MASRVEKQSRGGKRCVAGGPNLVSCGNSQYTDGVSVHLFPDKEKDNARHQKWVQFVRRYRPGWVPSKTSILCGSHFEESSFTMRRDIALQLGVKSFLKPDAVPTVHVANEAPKISEEMSDRDRRQVSEDLGPLAYFLVCCSFTFRPMSIVELICSELFF